MSLRIWYVSSWRKECHVQQRTKGKKNLSQISLSFHSCCGFSVIRIELYSSGNRIISFVIISLTNGNSMWSTVSRETVLYEFFLFWRMQWTALISYERRTYLRRILSSFLCWLIRKVTADLSQQRLRSKMCSENWFRNHVRLIRNTHPRAAILCILEHILAVISAALMSFIVCSIPAEIKGFLGNLCRFAVSFMIMHATGRLWDLLLSLLRVEPSVTKKRQDYWR